ncbi:hypothetical protein PR003_g22016 [Phytophthora rubi]|uniref:Uncharacterized protein n=1 Tax=Phytophthora rubi TaxID=129364 RepID=A0A6A4DBU9_9STRA|nr:hypothetical protein PR003_g22016 [Phytophthora rubi]
MQTASHWVWSFRAQVICNKCLPASCGSLPHIEPLINEYLIKYDDQKLLETACERGASQQILEFILMRTMPDWRNAAVAAARGGQLHVFQWMMERQDGRGPWRSELGACFEEAAAHGHLELLKSDVHPVLVIQR